MGFTVRPQSAAEQTGSNVRNFTEQLADGVQNFACQLWSAFPGFITQNQSLGASFVRGYFSTMCDPPTLPPPPAPPPFTGGQCPIRYNISYKSAIISNGTFEKWSDETFVATPANLIGPISNIVLLVNGTPDEDLEHWSFNGQGEEPALNTGTKTYIFRCTIPGGTVDVAQGTGRGRKFISVTPNSGQPDNCGNVAPDAYPDNPPDPDTDFVTNININNNEGDNLNFPLVYAPVNFNFPMQFDLGGIDVTLDLGGITFEGGDNNYPDGLGDNLPDGQQDPVSSPPPKKVVCQDDPPLPPEQDNDLDSEDLPETPSAEETGVEKLKYVRIILTEIPQGKGVQWGGGAAPNVYIAGWMEFRSGDFNYPRQPIHFQNNIFVAPDGADGFAYTLDMGFIGQATIYKVKVIE